MHGITSESAATKGTPNPPTREVPSSRDGSLRANGEARSAHDTSKLVPPQRLVRERIRQRITELSSTIDRTRLGRETLESHARQLVSDLPRSEQYVGWTMVMLHSACWCEAVSAVRFSRRLCLLPAFSVVTNEEATNNDGLAGVWQRLHRLATQLGYRVLVGADSPTVMQTMLEGDIEAIVGFANLPLLERALDKLLLVGIPCMALPVAEGNDSKGMFDEDWAKEMLLVEHAPAGVGQSYARLMQTASEMFTPEGIDRLVRRRATPGHDVAATAVDRLDPLTATETIACDFLTRGGKYSRPFMTLAAYDAVRSVQMHEHRDAQQGAEAIPDAVLRAAMCIEAFHKASLVHDDLQDNDDFRYGQPAIHRRWGAPTAINVGDYLIGLGYRLVSRESTALGAACVADILDCLAQAHLRLSEGQGAELIWRDALQKQLTTDDALRIYSLKTSPAFEAALYTGVRLAGGAESLIDAIRQFSHAIGVAFQILNDLGDWVGDQHNKLQAGGDLLGGRPTVLLALALAGLDDVDREALLAIVRGEAKVSDADRIAEATKLFQKADVFDKARKLVDEYQQLAAEVAAKIEVAPFRRLLQFLLETVLQRSANCQTQMAAQLPPPHIVISP